MCLAKDGQDFGSEIDYSARLFEVSGVFEERRSRYVRKLKKRAISKYNRFEIQTNKCSGVSKIGIGKNTARVHNETNTIIKYWPP